MPDRFTRHDNWLDRFADRHPGMLILAMIVLGIAIIALLMYGYSYVFDMPFPVRPLVLPTPTLAAVG